MSNEVITNITQISVCWLEEALKKSNILLSGRVKDFEIQRAASDNANFAKIKIFYTPEATDSVPSKLLLKMCSDNNSWDGSSFGSSEVRYYTEDYINLDDAPLPNFYDAHYSEERQAYHILLKDYSESHHVAWDKTITINYAHTFAETLAKLHAHNWLNRYGGQTNAQLPEAKEIDRYIDKIKLGFSPLLETIQNQAPISWENVLVRIFEQHPALMNQRIGNANGFTLIHGDLNPGNILVPNGDSGKIYFIDRQPFDWSLTTWLGLFDLAYYMILWWDTETRQKLENSVLQKYHECLLKHGVINYSKKQLLDDYKLSIIQCFYTVVHWCSNPEDLKNMKWVWYPQLEKGMAAYFDLDCHDILND